MSSLFESNRIGRMTELFLDNYKVDPSKFGIRFVEIMKLKEDMRYGGKGKICVSQKFLNMSEFEQWNKLQPSYLLHHFYDVSREQIFPELMAFATALFGPIHVSTVRLLNRVMHFIVGGNEMYVCTSLEGQVNLKGNPLVTDLQKMSTSTSLQPLIVERFGLLMHEEKPIPFDVKQLMTSINDTLRNLGHEDMMIFEGTDGYVLKYFGGYFTIYNVSGEFFITRDESHPLCQQCKLLDMILTD